VPFRKRLLLVLVLSIPPATSQGTNCENLKLPEVLGDRPCACGAALSNVKVTPPKGMKLVAVCGLLESGTGRSIDLTKERVSLDSPASSVDFSLASLYFAGTIEVSGEVRVSPGDSGFLWFKLDFPLASADSFIAKSYYGQLKLDSEIKRRPFGLPATLSDPKWFQCAKAKGRIQVSGVIVDLSGTGSGGTHSVGLKVLSHSPFENADCE
jgi:hypothetical protein